MEDPEKVDAAFVIALGEEEEEEDPEVMSSCLAQLSAAELERYEKFRRSRLSKATVTALLREVLPPEQPVADAMAIAVGGLAKLYVGDLVRAARAAATGDGPIAPEHYLAAARHLDHDLRDDVLVAPPPTSRRRLQGPPVITRDELL